MRLSAVPFELHAVWISLAVFAAALLLWRRWGGPPGAFTRRGVVVIGVAWTAFCTLEYWLFGPFSALGRPDEYHSSIPWIYYLTHSHLGGAYAHGFTGGVDAVAGMVTGTQHLSVERFAFAALPLWGTVLLLKGGAIAIAFSGGYKLARSGLGSSRANAVVVGLLASGAHAYNFAWSMGGLGWGTALLPWVFYFVCLRDERARYYVALVPLALIYSGSTAITHSLPALGLAGLAAFALVRPPRLLRYVSGALVFGVVAILNWSSTLIAAIQLAPESARANAAPSLISLKQWVIGNAEIFPLAAIFLAIAILTIRRDRFVLTAVPVMAVTIAAGTILSWLDWKATGINVLASYRWSLISDGYILPGLIVVARALGAAAPGTVRIRPAEIAAACAFAAVAVASAAYQKGLNLINYRYYGGQALLTRVEALAPGCEWRPEQPFRVVTIPSLFSPNTATAYGFNALDGSGNNLWKRSAAFFGMAVVKPARLDQNPQYFWLPVPDDANEIGASVDLRALHVANVRYVFSDRPLADTALRRVSPGCAKPAVTEASRRFVTWLTGWAPKAVPGDLYIYELPGAWPAAFVPDRLRVSAHSHAEPSFYQELLSPEGGLPTALVSREDAAMLKETALDPGAYLLTGSALVPGGFDVTVTPRRSDSGAKGLVVVNAPYTRFWRASSEGRALDIVPVNGVHFAVILDAAIRAPIRIRYDRGAGFTRASPD